MTVTYIAGANATTATDNLSMTIPATTQGQDVIIAACASKDTSILDVTGFTQVEKITPSGFGAVGIVDVKIAAGTAGSTSGDASTAAAFAVPVSGLNIKKTGALIVLRGANAAAAVNAHANSSANGVGTTYTGPAATSTVDGCMIVSVFMCKDSISGTPTITPPTGYTSQQQGIGTGTGRMECCIATKTAGAAGAYGADTWTLSGVPGSVMMFTLLIAPNAAIQILLPTSDVTVTNADGNPNDTAAQLYQNIDESGAPVLTDWVEIQQSGRYEHGMTTANAPGVNTGYQAQYTLGLGSGATSATFTITLYQNTTSIESWSETVTVDGTSYTHNISPTNAANIVYTSGHASNLRLDFQPTSVT